MPFRARLPPASILKRRTAIGRHLRSLPSCQLSISTRPITKSPSTLVDRHPGVVLVRYASSSSTTLNTFSNFFSFGKKSKKPLVLSLTNAREEYLRSASKGDTATLLAAYDILAQATRSTSTGQASTSRSVLDQEFLSNEDLILGLNALSNARDPSRAIERLRTVYNDVAPVFGYELDADHHSAYAYGLCRAGRFGEAFELLSALNPDDVDWSEFLNSAMKYDQDFVEPIWQALQAYREPTAQDYGRILRYTRRMVRRDPAKKEDLQGLLERIEREGVTMGFAGEADVASGYTALGELDRSKDIFASWEAKEHVGARLGKSAWLAKVDVALAEGDMDQAVRLSLEMREHGYDTHSELSYQLLRLGMDNGKDLDLAVSDVEQTLLSAIDTHAWTKLMNHYASLPGDHCNDIIFAYRLARSRGCEISTGLARAIIVPLNSQSFPRVDDAMEVFNDLLHAEADFYSIRDIKTLRAIMRSLINACARTSPPRSNTALEVIKQAANHHISIPNLKYELFMIIQNAGDHEIGYEIYAQYHNSAAIDAETFNWIMNAFITLTPPSDLFVFPTPDLFVEMMKNMYRTGLRPDEHVVTSLISRYGYLASASKGVPYDILRERHGMLSAALGDIHTRIKLDPLIDLSLPLLNALMDAYNRVGDPKSALIIWNEIVDRRSRLDLAYAKEQFPISVSIALDICGHNPQLYGKRAEKIWAWARRHGFTDETRAWNGWIETLCRLGRWDEASELVCTTMRNQVDGIPPPDLESIRLLTKFSWRMSRGRAGFLKMLKEAFPERWEQIEAEVRGASTEVIPDDIGVRAAGLNAAARLGAKEREEALAHLAEGQEALSSEQESIV
jgi:pentatricopeptide repeat protein